MRFYREHIGKHIENLWNNLGNTLGTNKSNKSNNPLTLPKRKKLGPLGGCWLTSLAAKNFYANLSLFFIIFGLARDTNCGTYSGNFVRLSYSNKFWFVVRRRILFGAKYVLVCCEKHSFWGQIRFGLL